MKYFHINLSNKNLPMGSTGYSYETKSRLASAPLDLLGHFEDASAATIFTYKLPHFLNI